MPDPVVTASKFLALILRHKPEVIGLTLDPNGWADIEEVVQKSNGRLTRTLVDRAVAENGKGRYAVSEDGKRIRARQGHSLKDVDVGLKPCEPPEMLFHGTYEGVVSVIKREGLKKMSRQHVHLSADLGTAKSVGGRRGRPVVFTVKARDMYLTGRHQFFLSENGVWLTDCVPPDYLQETV